MADMFLFIIDMIATIFAYRVASTPLSSSTQELKNFFENMPPYSHPNWPGWKSVRTGVHWGSFSLSQIRYSDKPPTKQVGSPSAMNLLQYFGLGSCDLQRLIDNGLAPKYKPIIDANATII